MAEPQAISVTETQIPDYLIKEEINGKPYFYKGYKSVLSNEKSLEEIMGSSNLQAFVISFFLEFLYENLDKKLYKIYTNEVGIHIKHKSNPACDIAIYEKEKLYANKITKHYTNIAPKVVIEVDVDIELPEGQSFPFSDVSYISKKTEALIEFGVEKVIWVLPSSKRILIASSFDDWHLCTWNRDIEVLDGISFNIAKFIEEEGVELTD